MSRSTAANTSAAATPAVSGASDRSVPTTIQSPQPRQRASAISRAMLSIASPRGQRLCDLVTIAGWLAMVVPGAVWALRCRNLSHWGVTFTICTTIVTLPIITGAVRSIAASKNATAAKLKDEQRP